MFGGRGSLEMEMDEQQLEHKNGFCCDGPEMCCPNGIHMLTGKASK